MTYAIMTPIYGIPLENCTHETIQEFLDNGQKGFLSYYSGSGSLPNAFGIVLGRELNECCHHIEATSFILTATDSQIEEFNKILGSLDDDIKKELKKFGPPRVFYLMSSS